MDWPWAGESHCSGWRPLDAEKGLIGDRAVERQYVYGEDGDVVLLNVDGCSEEQAKGLAAFF